MMRRNFPSLVILALVLIIGVLAFFLGRKSQKPSYESLINNTSFVKQIAELSGLEVQGSASLKHTNLQNDGSFTDAMRRMFLENTMNLSVPYTAKYGVDLRGQDIRLQEKDSVVTIYLPEPQLLSYELRMDNANAVSRHGWFQSATDAEYESVQKKLYTESRRQMETNVVYLNASKARIEKIMAGYYAPMHYKVKVVFGKEQGSLETKPEN